MQTTHRPVPRGSANVSGSEPGRVLMVCTGNECRSPAAELLLRDALAGRSHADWAPAFEVWSAGTRAQDGAPLHPLTAQALARRGITPRRHRARGLQRQDLQGADLQNADLAEITETAKDYARKNPGQTILISAAAGLLIGLILRGRR